MANEKNDAVEDSKMMYWVMKVNVPLGDGSLFHEWDKSVSAKAPIGFGDYRWGKIAHDHLFVEKFKERLEAIEKNLERIEKLLEKKNDEKDDTEGLMKR